MTPERLQELRRDPGYQDVAEEIDRLTQVLARVEKHQERAQRLLRILEVENERLREYIGLAADFIARLLTISGYPTLEQVLPDASKLKRMEDLKAELFDKSVE